MSTYVCSDIHGRYDRYMKLLDEIKFSSSDVMYILGDVIDRNPDGIEILLDIQQRPNVHLFIGNHELFMIDSITNGDPLEVEESWFDNWTMRNNGGIITFNKFKELSPKVRKSILDMLKDCLVIKVLKIGNRTFHLSHSSTLQGFVNGELRHKDVSHGQLMEIVWKSIFRLDNEHEGIDKYSKDLTYIVGHVPVQQFLDENIVTLDNIIDIDCGCGCISFVPDYLACLRLEDMKEFYVK